MSAVIDIHHLDEEDRELVRYMAEESMSVKKAAQRMCLSVSATRYRLRRIVTRTGADPRTFFGLARLYYAVESAEKIRRR